MMLTFAFFVGLAVAGVGLYTFLVLRGQVQEAERQTLREEVERIAVLLEAEPDGDAVRALAGNIAGVTHREVSVARLDTAVTMWRPFIGPIDPDFFRQPEVLAAFRTGVGYAERQDGASGEALLYVASYRDDSKLIVRLGEPSTPLYLVLQKVQATLIVGMALALLLSLVGAWIAARQVAKPLRAITQNARLINEGELDRAIRVKTRAAEFQDLARSLTSSSSD